MTEDGFSRAVCVVVASEGAGCPKLNTVEPPRPSATWLSGMLTHSLAIQFGLKILYDPEHRLTHITCAFHDVFFVFSCASLMSFNVIPMSFSLRKRIHIA